MTTDDVIAMTRAGVSEQVIATHVRNHGMAAPLQAGDLIMLSQQGVSPLVVQAMQAPPVVQPVAYPAPVAAPVIVQERFVAGPPYWGYYHCHPRHYHRPGVSWGVSVSH